MAYGDVRLRLQQIAGSVGLDLLDGWIQDRYQQILDRIDWKRKDTVGTIQTAEEYSDGDVDLTAASATVTGNSTTFTSSMTGWTFRIDGGPEFYTFTYVGATSGTLDRAYEGDTDTEIGYTLNKRLFALSSSVRQITAIHSFETGKTLGKLSLAEMNRMAPRRDTYGNPEYWCLHIDGSTTPPTLVVELYPIPQEVKGFHYEGYVEETMPDESSDTLLPWIRPNALIAGVTADIWADKENLGMARHFEAKFESLVKDLINSQSRVKGHTVMRMARRFTLHNVRRYLR